MPQDTDSNIQKQLDSLSKLLNEPGEPVNYGCPICDLEKMISRCREIDNPKAYCVVQRWMLWDVGCHEDSIQDTLLIVYSNDIYKDEASRIPPGGWVRSSPILDINDQCIFSTRNTHYILLGKGTRKRALVGDVAKLL